MPASRIETPTGPVIAVSDGVAITRVTWLEDRDAATFEAELSRGEDDVSRETARQLGAYFAGELTAFSVPLRYDRGSDFEIAIWNEMRAIPHGEVRTYGDLAARTQGIARAVGTACGRNPIPIIIPCHRVVGSDGKLVGFSGGKGVETKSWLRDFERGQARLF